MPHDLSIAYEILGTMPEVKSAFFGGDERSRWDITAILGESPC
jgi:hypothetical protein